LARGALGNGTGGLGKDSALHLAAKYGHTHTVRMLVTNPVIRSKINAKAGYRRDTALHRAAEHGFAEVAAALLANGADVNATSNVCRCCSGHYNWQGAWVAAVSFGSNHHPVKEYKKTPLHFAAREGHLDVVQVLLDWGANINARDFQGVTPLELASKNAPFELASKNGNSDIVDLLVVNGAKQSKI